MRVFVRSLALCFRISELSLHSLWFSTLWLVRQFEIGQDHWRSFNLHTVWFTVRLTFWKDDTVLFAKNTMKKMLTMQLFKAMVFVIKLTVKIFSKTITVFFLFSSLSSRLITIQISPCRFHVSLISIPITGSATMYQFKMLMILH